MSWSISRALEVEKGFSGKSLSELAVAAKMRPIQAAVGTPKTVKALEECIKEEHEG
jgi:hypothetical protein